MSQRTMTTKQLAGLRAIGGKKGKSLGKVRRFVFHPTERRLIGVLVKRPDAALMFHRKDLFVALDGFTLDDGCILVHDDASATDKGALKALGVDWDRCVLWVGMPLMTQSGDFLGYADTVTFDAATGDVLGVATENGAASDVILGKREIPASMIKGFRLGQGMAVAADGECDPDGEAALGAILVSDEALAIDIDGGVASAAGKATAVVADKAKKGAAKAKTVAKEQALKAKPAMDKAARKTGEVVEEGAYALGRQLGRTSGMFAAFKEEYRKAVKDDDGR